MRHIARMDDEHEIRAHSDHMVELIEKLHFLEEQKHHVGVGSPEFVSLAHEIERLSRLVFRWSGMQTQTAEHAAVAVTRGEMTGRPLDEFPPRPMDVILAAWREAQFRFELSEPGSEEATTAAADIERLREEFHAAQEVKQSAVESRAS
jgi:hypothetical protein